MVSMTSSDKARSGGQDSVAKLFLSHSTDDDAIVRDLRQALGDLGQDVWIDSRELRGGDALRPEIQRAIEEARAYAVLISPGSLQSSWVGKELRHALKVQNQRGKDAYRVVPLLLDATRPGALGDFFDEQPLYVPLRSTAGGVEAALHAILSRWASGRRPTSWRRRSPRRNRSRSSCSTSTT